MYYQNFLKGQPDSSLVCFSKREHRALWHLKFDLAYVFLDYRPLLPTVSEVVCVSQKLKPNEALRYLKTRRFGPILTKALKCLLLFDTGASNIFTPPHPLAQLSRQWYFSHTLNKSWHQVDQPVSRHILGTALDDPSDFFQPWLSRPLSNFFPQT